MSGIPYNRLQTVEATAKTSNGETVVMETLYYAFVVPCRYCKHYNTDFGGGCAYFHIGNGYGQEPENMSDGFCAWGERKRLTCKCGEELESEGKCPSCGRWVHD